MKLKHLVKPWLILFAFTFCVQIPALAQLSAPIDFMVMSATYFDYALVDSQNIPHQSCQVVSQPLQICSYQPYLLPLALVVFIVPLFPIATRMIYRVLNIPRLPRPKRV